MKNENLQTALDDLKNAIKGITLGSVEHIVISEAGETLIENWNDHNPDDKIDEGEELNNWLSSCMND